MLDKRLAIVAASVFKAPLESLSPDTALDGVQGWDSLGHLQFILEVEREFKVQFPTEQIAALTTLRQIQSAIESLTTKAP